MKKKLLKSDKNFIWHPFTKIKNEINPILISEANNEILIDVDGKEYVDLISSWWVNIHGHCRKEIIEKICYQSKKLEQVLFAGFTHEPAIQLAEKLTNILPKKLNKVFYSDNGSTAVEIALKVAIQYWFNKGKKKIKFVAFEGGYHGDTFGAMSVGFSSGFYKPFKDFVRQSTFLTFPEYWKGNNEIDKNEKTALVEIEKILDKNHNEIAAVIIEPLVQGASGMKICRKEFLEKVVRKFKSAGIIVIFDEVLTGFGRTGKMFAMDFLDVKPDILCLAKSLTGGCLPLAATVFDEKIYQAFLDSDIEKAFLHGHSYTANPVSCAAAIKSLELFETENTLKKIGTISSIHKQCLEYLSKELNISRTRSLGDIAAFDINSFENDYGSKKSELLKKEFLNNGLLLRPIGNTIYLMPPYCIKKEQLQSCYMKISKILKQFQN